MSVRRFLEYAAAFERAYASRDWSPLEAFFTEDATYTVRGRGPLGTEQQGRDAVLAYFDWVTDVFDRRFEERKLVVIDPPAERDGSVVLHGAAVYRLKGERYHVILTETAAFEGERIQRLVDDLTPGTLHEVELLLGRYPERFPASFSPPGAPPR